MNVPLAYLEVEQLRKMVDKGRRQMEIRANFAQVVLQYRLYGLPLPSEREMVRRVSAKGIMITRNQVRTLLSEL